MYYLTIILLAFSLSINTKAQQTGIFTDSRDGKAYKTVKIGNQTWMAENLNYETSSGSWCYDDDPANCEKYGRLYDWETAKTVCPPGWRLPSKSDFETLFAYIGGDEEETFHALKEGGSSGFNALLGGWRYCDGYLSGLGYYGQFWSFSTLDLDYDKAWCLLIGVGKNDYTDVGMDASFRIFGLSVRCLQDSSR